MRKLPNRIDIPIKIDNAKIENRNSIMTGFTWNSEDIFDRISELGNWTRPIIRSNYDITTNNPYYEHPNIMSKYSKRKFKNPAKCPRCKGNHHINYMGDYVSHNTMYHGADFDIVIQELEKLIE